MTEEQIIRLTIDRTLETLGIKPRSVKTWITQAEAGRMLSVRKVAKAMSQGKIEFYKDDYDSPRSRVWLKRKDVEKLM